VPGNFHISTHASREQPAKADMTHEINAVIFGDSSVHVWCLCCLVCSHFGYWHWRGGIHRALSLAPEADESRGQVITVHHCAITVFAMAL